VSPVIGGGGGGGGGLGFHGVRLYFTNNAAASNPVSWPSVTFDTDGYYSAGAPTVITIPPGLGGYYHVGFNLDPAGSPSGWLNPLIATSAKSDAICGTVTSTSLGLGNPLIVLSAVWGPIPAGATVWTQFFSQNAVTFSGGDDTAFWAYLFAKA
jgi:hypothetical protein